MRRHDSVETCQKPIETGDSDAFSNLLQKRVLFLADEINSDTANRICAQLMTLDFEGHKDIYLFINSEGGNVTDTMAVYDVMQAVRSDVSTICIGEASSGAALLLSGGTRGRRHMLPHARVMLHQPNGGVEGTSRDVEIEARELLRLRELMSRIFEKHTSQSREKLQYILDRDSYMDAKKAVEFGVADSIIDRLPDFEN